MENNHDRIPLKFPELFPSVFVIGEYKALQHSKWLPLVGTLARFY